MNDLANPRYPSSDAVCDEVFVFSGIFPTVGHPSDGSETSGRESCDVGLKGVKSMHCRESMLPMCPTRNLAISSF
jgi:hypothetical protein